MNTLRVLVVDSDPAEAERLARVLADAHHAALPANGLEEASEALFVQKFDAVLLSPPLPSDGIAGFTAKLRALEKSQRTPMPTPVLCLSSQVPGGADWCAGERGVDAYLTDSFQPTALWEAVTSLAAAIARAPASSTEVAPEFPVFEVEQFRAQVCHDDELMGEIIDSFLSESPGQVVEMCEALAASDFERLSRVAHTIKGSFATLHAGVARSRAQDIETAAKNRDAAECAQKLSALERDLALLEPQLQALRNTCAQP